MRGGAREGAGRKSGREQKVTISFRVTQDIKDRIQKARNNGIDTNAILDKVMEAISK